MNLGEWLWAMFVFFLWFQVIFIFIRVFADIFHRRDLSGAAKAGWIFLLFILPFLGALIYMIARPKMTEQDREDIQRAQAMQQRALATRPLRRSRSCRSSETRGRSRPRSTSG